MRTGFDVNSGPLQRVVIYMREDQAARFAVMAERHRDLEGEWVAAEAARLVAGGVDLKGAERRARSAAVPLRAERWPTQDGVVERLVRLRLGEADVAELQGPLLDRNEEAALRLAGRRPGSSTGHYRVPLGATMPAGLVLAGRRAAWRLSGGSANELRQLLALRRERAAGLSERAYRKARAAVLGSMGPVVTWAELVRQAAERYDV